MKKGVTAFLLLNQFFLFHGIVGKAFIHKHYTKEDYTAQNGFVGKKGFFSEIFESLKEKKYKRL